MFDAEIPTLEMQALVPIQDTNEMGMLIPDLIKRLEAIDEYQSAARKIFNRGIDSYVITRALAAFQRSLVSDNSRFDQAQRGEIERSDAEQRGWELFSDELYCTKCHTAPHFTTFIAAHNGIYSEGDSDKGRFRIDFDSTEIGLFKIPSLRNIELTAPYMHDGSAKSLDEVLDHYESGGSRHINQSKVIQPFKLSKRDRSDLLIFLNTLTDTTYMDRFR
jgi:cytochrome c peroxidase